MRKRPVVAVATPAEPRWTDLSPEERRRRLAAPIQISTHGTSHGWGGTNINEGRHTIGERLMQRDQWYLPDFTSLFPLSGE